MKQAMAWLLLLGLLISTLPVFAASPIMQVNNQASINILGQHNNVNYYNNSGNYLLHNLHGNALGVDFGLNKTIYRFYTSINMNMINGTYSYKNPSFGLSKATILSQEISGRLGYLFLVKDSLGLTPYLSLGYQTWQLDTGGMPDTNGYYKNGITQITRSMLYGAGLLGQWAIQPKWVISGDLTLFDLLHPWTDLRNGIEESQVEATLSNQLSWQLALSSDYRISPRVHTKLGVKYTQTGYGSAKGTNNLAFPSQTNHQWQVNAGLGYALDEIDMGELVNKDHKPELVAANNQADLLAGCLFQNYGEKISTSTAYYDRETGEMPQLTMTFSKTLKNIYGQITFSQANGDTHYHADTVSSGTRNIITDINGRLGYQQYILPNLSLTPYGIWGYHRWLRTIAYVETYHNDWYGWGGMLQWSPHSHWVLKIDGNVGRTYNGQIHSWVDPGSGTANLVGLNLRPRTYIMGSLGVDYNFIKVWHALANVNYWRFNYGRSETNSLELAEPNSNTWQVGIVAGVGYSFL